MIVIAGNTRGFGEQRRLHVLQNPEIAVHVIAFHLMRGRGCAPEEVIGKFL
jgi:hypothetical protein